jgi:hypothetical protein
MSLFTLFNTRAEKQLAHTLVDALASNISPTLMTERRTALSVNKITRLLEKSFETAVIHQREHGMGYLRRVVFLHSFRWELQQRNYPDDFIQTAVEGMLVALSTTK